MSEEAPAEAGSGWRLTLRALARLPLPAISRVTGRLADVRIPRPLRRPVLGTFARLAGIDVGEASLPLGEYPTFDAFFVRRLRDDVRPLPEEPGIVVSPVDGQLGATGPIDEDRLLQAKGLRYTVSELLDDAADASRFMRGAFVTLYLSPRHYHRIHAPTAGSIGQLRRVPGTLLPVNQAAATSIDRLFARNERAICMLDGPAGRVAVVAVGAFNVGRITAAFGPGGGEEGTQLTNLRDDGRTVWRCDPPIAVKRGDEIMAFHLGSTVILLFEPGRLHLEGALRRGAEVRLGARIGVLKPAG